MTKLERTIFASVGVASLVCSIAVQVLAEPQTPDMALGAFLASAFFLLAGLVFGGAASLAKGR